MPVPVARKPWQVRPGRIDLPAHLVQNVPLTAAVPLVTAPPFLNGNLLTPADSDFEQALTGNWGSLTNCTVALSAAQAFSGSQSLAITATTTGTVTIRISSPYLTAVPVAGYIMSGYAWTPASGRTLQPSFSFYDNTLTLLTTSASGSQALTQGAWTPMTYSAASPGAAAAIQPRLIFTGMQAGETVWLDLVFVARPLAQILTAWQSEPGSTSPLFADMTPFTRADVPVTWTRGRQDNLSEVQPASLSLTLANDTGWFTAQNAGSPFYPDIKIGRRIQVNVPDEAGAFHTRFDGTVNSLELVPAPTGLTADTQVAAADIISVLNRQSELSSWTKQEVLLDSPLLHWTLDDPAGSSVAAETSGNDGPPLQLHEYGSGGTFAFAGGTAETNGVQNGMESQTWAGIGTPAAFPAVYFDQAHAGSAETSQGNWQLQALLPFTLTAGVNTWTIEAFLIPDVPNAAVYSSATGFTFYAFTLGSTRTGAAVALLVTGGASPAMSVVQYNSLLETPPSVFGTFAGPPWSGSTPGPVEVAVRFAAGGISLVVNGSLANSTLLVNPETYDYITVGGPLGGFEGWLGQISCLSIYAGVLSTTRLTAHSQAGSQGKYGSGPGAIISSVAQYAAIPAFWDNLSGTSGLSDLDYFTLAGTNALTAMQTVEQADGGLLYANAAGQICYSGRESRMGAGPPALTMTAGQYEADLGYKVTDQYLVNTAAYSSAGISAGVAIANDQSVLDYGTYSAGTAQSPTELPLLTYNSWYQSYLNGTGGTVGAFSPDNLTFAAQWAANSHAQPLAKGASVRVDMLTLPVSGPDGIAPSVLYGLDIGSVISLTGLPSQFPSAAHASEYFIEGVTETIGGGENAVHDLSFYTSPASQGRAWIAGDPVYGQLDSTALIGRSAPPSATPPGFEFAGATFPGPPYYPPSYGSAMNSTGFVGDLDQAAIWANLQQQLNPPMVVLQQQIASQTVASGTSSHIIVWDTAAIDTLGGQGWLAGFSNWYFILVPGWWQLYGAVEYASAAGGKRTAWFAVAQRAARNGTGPVTANANIIGSVSTVPSASFVAGLTLSAKVYCTLGTAISIQTWQNSGGTVSTSTARGGSMLAARFLGDTAVQD